MIHDIQFKRSIVEAVLIAVIASLIGIFVNLFRPEGVVITLSRPDTAYVTDDVLNDENPGAEAELSEPVVINREQLKNLLTGNRAVLLDARMPEAYAKAHLPGAINVPFEMLGQFMNKIENLSRADWVIAYCDAPPCELGELLANELKNMGFTRVAYYPDGVDDWINAGEPVAGGIK